MDASILNLTRLFEPTRRYLVPLYQRPYVWARDTHWEPLWEDVELVAERVLKGEKDPRAHFIGALVLERQERSIADVETRLVIDGQQRLTTLQLLLEALADVAKTRNLDKVQRRAEKLVRNDEIYVRTDDERFKVWPTAIDQDAFQRVMLRDTAAQVRGDFASDTGKGIPGAYLYFVSAIEEWLDVPEGAPEERAEALYRALKDFVRLVVIELSDDDDAQAIFETLNARGAPLRPSDLVKNVLLQRVRDEGGSPEKSYRAHWAPFDAADEYWSAELGRGHAARPRIDIFLKHYLTARTRADIAVPHLYSEFRVFLRDAGEPADHHLEALSAYAGIYRLFDAQGEDSPLGPFFARLRTLEVGTAYPWLLEAFRRLGPDSKAIPPALAVFESFLVRRAVCCLNTRGYNRLFLDAIPVIDGDPSGLADRLSAWLLEGRADSNRWPADAEFEQAWMDEPLYQRLRADRVNMLLRALERKSRGPLTEKVAIEPALQVEHLMPQQWLQNWPLPAGAAADAGVKRDRLLHTLGNLTLLTGKLNPTVSNDRWERKRPAIDEHSVLMLNRKVVTSETWDEDVIRQRGRALFQTALVLWPRPADPASTKPVAVPAPPVDARPAEDSGSTGPDSSVEEFDFADRQVGKRLVNELVSAGLDENRFRLLHHFRPEAQPSWPRLRGFLDYCDRPGRFTSTGTNADTIRRVAACLAALRGGADWEGAIRAAHERIPRAVVRDRVIFSATFGRRSEARARESGFLSRR